MDKIRIYGNEPFRLAVIHGGPGAPGSMKPLAEELVRRFEVGVLEPMQTKDSIEGQLQELKLLLDGSAEYPIVLIGHSWGAWLSCLFAERYPELVRKLILVGCGSFEDKYLKYMNSKRENRLTEEENTRVGELFGQMNNKDYEIRQCALKEFGVLMMKADSYDPSEFDDHALDFMPNVFQNCMKELSVLRSNGELLGRASRIKCPVVAFHGEYDSHSYEGVQAPLESVLKEFSFHLLKDCGHTPWNEKQAKEEFYHLIALEIQK